MGENGKSIPTSTELKLTAKRNGRASLVFGGIKNSTPRLSTTTDTSIRVDSRCFWPES